MQLQLSFSENIISFITRDKMENKILRIIMDYIKENINIT